MITDINSEDRLVQQTFAEHLEKVLSWNSVYAYNAETFGPNGTLGRISERDVVLVRDLHAALERLKPDLLASLRDLLRTMHDWTQNTATQADVKVCIFNNLCQALPRPPFTEDETEAVTNRVYDFVWQQSASGHDLTVAQRGVRGTDAV